MEERELKEKLVEELGVYFEKTLQLTPLAARLYGLLMLCPKSGHSFEEIVELSQSSKSSVSVNINLLLNSGIIEYFTKPGEHKRFFRLSKNYLKVSLQKYKNQLSEEIQLLQKVKDFNVQHNKEKHEKHKAFTKMYGGYLEKQYQNLESTINKMNQIEKEFI